MPSRGEERTELAGFNLNDLLVENTHEFAMFGIDLSGTVISWNPGVKMLLGFEREEWVGQSTSLIFTPEDLATDAPSREMERAAREGETADVRWHLRKDGHRFWANGIMTALFTPDGEHIGYAKVIRDETEKKRLEVERARLVKQLSEERDLVDGLNTILQQRVSEGLQELAETSTQLNREMSERQEVEESTTRLVRELRSQSEELESMTYSISHDLRSPLRGLDGFSQALLEDYEGILDDTGKRYLKRIRASAQLIGELIDDLLDLSRLSRREMKWVEVDLSHEAAKIIERLRRNSPERNVEAVIEQGLVAHGDPDMLVALLENLLINAWKFTSNEEIARIEVGVRQEEDERRFFVRDNGIGFDMRYAGRLFAPFQRLHSANEFEGTGVGLATARRIVLRHGGQLRAHSQPGDGALFSFTLSAEPQEVEGDTTQRNHSGLEEAVEETGESAS